MENSTVLSTCQIPTLTPRIENNNHFRLFLTNSIDKPAEPGSSGQVVVPVSPIRPNGMVGGGIIAHLNKPCARSSSIIRRQFANNPWKLPNTPSWWICHSFPFPSFPQHPWILRYDSIWACLKIVCPRKSWFITFSCNLHFLTHTHKKKYIHYPHHPSAVHPMFHGYPYTFLSRLFISWTPDSIVSDLWNIDGTMLVKTSQYLWNVPYIGVPPCISQDILGLSIINHPIFGTPILGKPPHVCVLSVAYYLGSFRSPHHCRSYIPSLCDCLR